MNYAQILTDLKAQKYQPVYFLHGDEPYFIDLISNYIAENVLSESEKDFNQAILFGKETDAQTVLDYVSRMPMMSQYQVVIVKEAQEMRSLSKLTDYIQKPFPSSILVLCHKHKKLDSRTSLGKVVKKHAVVMESKKLYENQIPDWVAHEVHSLGYEIEPAALQMITDYLGTDLSKIQNEINKLTINLKEKERITPATIERNIGISKDYNVFELQRALAGKNRQQTMKIIQHFTQNIKDHPLVMIISVLFNFYSKLLLYLENKNLSDSAKMHLMGIRSPFFMKEYHLAARNYHLTDVEQCIHILAEYDLRGKGVKNSSLKQEELLKEMAYHLLHSSEFMGIM